MTTQVIETVNHEQVQMFTKHLHPHAKVQSDAYPALNIMAKHCKQQAEVTPPENASKWLRLVHIVISNLKRFLLGTFHDVSGKYLQEYIHEFVYRFNRRYWQDQLPQRLLNAVATHAPIFLKVILTYLGKHITQF